MPAATIARRLLGAESGCQMIHRCDRQFVLTVECEAFYCAYTALLGSEIISCWSRQLFHPGI